MDEHSAIPEKDAASTLPEEPVELITPVDEPQPGSTEQVEPSPEDPPPAEPPKKESIWKKHKGKILGALGVAALFIAGGIGLVLTHHKPESDENDPEYYPLDTPNDTPVPKPELSEFLSTCESVFDSPHDVSDETAPPNMELCRESVRSHPRLLPLGKDASPEKKAELEASGHPLTNGDRNYTNVNKFDRDVLRPAKKECS